MSEGGIGWVPALLDRLDHMTTYSSMYGTWDGIDISPADVLKRNFWFCAVEDPSTMVLRDRIGVDHISSRRTTRTVTACGRARWTSSTSP